MKTIYIGFSYHKGFAPISYIIRKVLKTDFSHTYFKFKQENLDYSTIYHAVGKGLNYISEPNFLEDNTVVKEFKLEIDDELYIHILNLCHNNAYKKYGFLQNLGIFFVKILKKFNITYRRNPFNDGINCSEWNAKILFSIYPDWSNKSTDLIDPKDCFLFLKEKFPG